jgi:hypothetical protein
MHVGGDDGVADRIQRDFRAHHRDMQAQFHLSAFDNVAQ